MAVFYFMNEIYDANVLYEAGKGSIKASTFKYSTQLFEMNQLLETAKIQKKLMERTYKPQQTQRFLISERGKTRFIASNTMIDKTVNHAVCDNVVMPCIQKKLIYDNGASQKGKGVSFTRKRLLVHLHKYWEEYHTNDGYILLIDFSGYYANVDHQKCKEMLKSIVPDQDFFPQLLDQVFKTFEFDVSYMSDQEVSDLYKTKVNPVDLMVDNSKKTGQKFLHKGVGIGNQLSQAVGIVYPYMIDNYVKIVRSMKYYARYTDDMYIIHHDKAVLQDVLKGIQKIADDYGLIINPKKTRICKISNLFRFLQIGYFMREDGTVVRKINPKNVTRERRKLKAYKRLLDAEKLTYPEIENSFRSWIGSNYKLMSHIQIQNIRELYVALFGKEIKWKKSQLNYLMEQNWKTLK
jgi:DNA-binding transcriptional regulator YhcF (GntR family)